MSDDGFHVHGPHDHAVEHVAEHGGDDFSNKIAVLTAVLATFGAMFGYEGGATQNDAAMFKNNAAIVKTSASDQWNYYQAKSNKQALAELATTIPGVDQEKYKGEAARYADEKAKIKKEAEELDKKSKEWEEKSDEKMHEHHIWAESTTAMQVAIAMAAISMLTRKRWLEYACIGLGVAGLILGVSAFFHVDLLGMLHAGGAEAAAHH